MSATIQLSKTCLGARRGTPPSPLYDPKRGDINKVQTRCASFKFDCQVKIITFGHQSQTKAKGSLTDFLASPPIISPQSSHLHQLTLENFSDQSNFSYRSSLLFSHLSQSSLLISRYIRTYIHSRVCIYYRLSSPLSLYIRICFIHIHICVHINYIQTTRTVNLYVNRKRTCSFLSKYLE